MLVRMGLMRSVKPFRMLPFLKKFLGMLRSQEWKKWPIIILSKQKHSIIQWNCICSPATLGPVNCVFFCNLFSLFRMVLEIINSCLVHQTQHNPNLIYTILYKKEMFEVAAKNPAFQVKLILLFTISIIKNTTITIGWETSTNWQLYQGTIHKPISSSPPITNNLYTKV